MRKHENNEKLAVSQFRKKYELAKKVKHEKQEKYTCRIGHRQTAVEKYMRQSKTISKENQLQNRKSLFKTTYNLIAHSGGIKLKTFSWD